jgi:hypothetical protein
MEPNIEPNPTNGEQPPEPKRKGRPKGSKNKSKSVEPNPDLNGTDRAAGEVSTENTSKNESLVFSEANRARARFLEANRKNITKLQNFAVQRLALTQTQPLIDRINYGFDAADEAGRNLLSIARDTGTLLFEWKAAAGHGNWVEAYESSGFNKSIDTARNWMRLSMMTDAEIAEVDSMAGALRFLKDEKERKKGRGGNPNSGMDDDNGDGDNAEPNSKPEPAAPEPEPEPDSLADAAELEKVMKRVCATHSREEVARMVASMLNDFYQPKEEDNQKKEVAL